jgi:Flp pilus assembly protein TadB
MKRTKINKKRFFLFLILVMIPPFLSALYPQEAKVNQRKIEKEHKRKDKKAEKEYNQAKKDHQKRQSKETQSMMKKSRKQSKKNTPMKAPGGKKCK